MPCFGANKKASKNSEVVASAMTGPDGKLYKKLKYKPITDDNAPKNPANTTMTDNLFVSRYAVDAGVISIDTTKMTPTVCKDATVTNVSKNMIV